MFCCPTFGSFDEFDLNDGLYHGSAAPNIQPNNGARHLQGLHGLTVRDLRHVCVVDPQDAVVDPGRQRSGLPTSVMANSFKSNSQTRVSAPKNAAGIILCEEKRTRETAGCNWLFLVSTWDPVSSKLVTSL